MFFRSAFIAIFLASAASSALAQNEVCFKGTYDDLFPIELGPDDCNFGKFRQVFKNRFKANMREDRKKPKRDRVRCKHGLEGELAALTGQSTKAHTIDYISLKCAEALKSASEEFDTGTPWSTIEDEDVALDEFFMGGTFLNSETGNFQQDPAEFKNDRDKYIYMGDDPRYNDHYPTTEESYAAGLAIQSMYNEESRTSFFGAPKGFEGGCAAQTAMCCWHRDRQYFDDNGGCDSRNCANKNPADNTDLCWTELEGEVFPYPGSTTEKAVHCHGLAWSSDTSGKDINEKGKWNTLFYVSLYDHLNKRGYAEGLAQDPNLMVEQPMCGCIEDMAPVARADCSEIVGTASYTATLDEEGLIVINPVEGTFELSFQACEGFRFKEGANPTTYKESGVKGLGLTRKDNDLAAFLFKHYLEDDISEEKVDTVKKTLIGYENPEVNKSDADREAACEAAFKKAFPGEAYEEKTVVA